MNTLKDKNCYILWASSILGALSVLPYVSTVINEEIITPSKILSTALQSALVYGLIVLIGLKASDKLHFRPDWSSSIIIPSLISGLGVGLFLKLSDTFIFSTTAAPEVSLWKSFLASFYGGINEEIMMRLFGVTIITLLLVKLAKLNKDKSILIAILACALIFGLGHLPMLYNLEVSPGKWDIVRVLTLNGVAGITFGYVYWRYSLTASMLSHFIADLVIHCF